MRQITIKFILLLSVFSFLTPDCDAQTRQVEKPNFLIVLSDDLTYHDLGCYGNQDIQTPNIDQLAREGLRFEYCFNSAPMCAPTRMSLFTGIHPVRNGAHPNHSRIYDHVQTMPEYLTELGYEVGLLGKRHFKPLEKFSFEFLGGRGHDDGEGLDLDLDKVAEFITRPGEKPWCLVVASNQSHTPWTRGDATAYDAQKLTLPPYLVDTEVTRDAMTRYYAEITYFDEQLGTCLDHLKASGQADNTIVIYLSEQGSNLPHSKWTCYENGLRSAAIIRYPGLVKANSSTKAMIQYIDVLPTLIEAAGGDPTTSDFDGKSFWSVLSGQQKKHRTYSYGVQTSKGIFEGPDAFGIRSVRNKRHRLVWNLNHENEFSNLVIVRGGPEGVFGSWEEAARNGNRFAGDRTAAYRKRPEWELYDLKKDPYEMKNLVSQNKYRKLVERLRKELQSWMKQQNDLGHQTELDAPNRQKK